MLEMPIDVFNANTDNRDGEAKLVLVQKYEGREAAA
jgi:hypothetical protein